MNVQFALGAECGCVIPGGGFFPVAGFPEIAAQLAANLRTRVCNHVFEGGLKQQDRIPAKPCAVRRYTLRDPHFFDTAAFVMKHGLEVGKRGGKIRAGARDKQFLCVHAVQPGAERALLGGALQQRKITRGVKRLRLMDHRDIAVEDAGLQVNGFVHRIDPPERPQAAEQFRPVFGIKIISGIVLKLVRVLHLDDFRLRRKIPL